MFKKVYEKFLDAKARRAAEALEFLDELEEWQLLMSHYCLCLATTGGEGSTGRADDNLAESSGGRHHQDSSSVALLAARLVKALDAPPP